MPPSPPASELAGSPGSPATSADEGKAGGDDLPRLSDAVLALLRSVGAPESTNAVEMAAHLHARVPELDEKTVGTSAFDETAACCRAHLDQIVRLLVAGRSPAATVVPAAAIDHARSLARRRVPLDALLRAYRLGHRHLSTATAHLLDAGLPSDEPPLPAVTAVGTFLFDYVDRVCDEIVEVYRDEHDRWVRSAAAVRSEALHALLDGEIDDEHLVEQRLGYALAGHHLAAVLVAGDATHDPVSLQHEVEAMAEEVGATGSLVVPAGGSAVWAWLRSADGFDPAAIERQESRRPNVGVRVALGRPGAGATGFRVSHLEARRALAFAERHPRVAPEGGPVAYAALELVSLLAEDPDRAVRFVRRQLGPLAGGEPQVVALRAAVLAYLRHGRSPSQAGCALYLHKNTVANRVRRAERLVGQDSSSWGVEFTVALMLADVLDPLPGG